jgi:drug/metabolite transporter superfamily protein YnfA
VAAWLALSQALLVIGRSALWQMARKFQPVRFALVALATNFGNGVGMWFLIKSNLSPLISQVVTVSLTALGFIAPFLDIQSCRHYIAFPSALIRC